MYSEQLKALSQGDCTKLKTWPSQPCAMLCMHLNGWHGCLPFTSPILIPLPTEQVRTCFVPVGTAHEGEQQNRGSQRSVQMLYPLLRAAHNYRKSIQSALAPYPRSEPPIFKDNNPLSLSEGFAPSHHILTVIQKQDFLTLSGVYCAQNVSYCPENYSLGEH